MKVVVDTNIVVSRYLTPGGVVAPILAYWRQKRFDLVVSEPILVEYGRVLGYPYLRARHQMTDINSPRSLPVCKSAR